LNCVIKAFKQVR